MALFYVLAILCSVVRADEASDALKKYWTQADCNAFKDVDNCTAIGWCLWTNAGGNNNCNLDPCLAAITTATQCPAVATGGVACGSFYFTNTTDCNGSPNLDDMFCQAKELVANGTAGSFDVVPSYFDWCFYKTLEISTYVPANGATPASGEWKLSGALCDWKSVTLPSPSTTGVKQYSGQKDGVEDCSGLYTEGGYSQEYCNCLGPDHCPLVPYCYVTTIDNKKTCVYDDCTQDLLDANCVNNGKCWKRNMNVKDSASSTLQRKTLCVNKARKDNAATQLPNECYLLQDISTDCGSNAKERCEAGNLYDDEFDENKAGTVLTGDKEGNCAWVPIAPGIIPASNYCTDTRTVPSPESDGSVIVRVSSLFLLFLALVFFF